MKKFLICLLALVLLCAGCVSALAPWKKPGFGRAFFMGFLSVLFRHGVPCLVVRVEQMAGLFPQGLFQAPHE